MSRQELFTPPGPLCVGCGACCRNMPGAMSPYDLPGEPVAAAAALLDGGRWCLDWWEGDTEPDGPLPRVYYLRPAQQGHEGERFHAGWRGTCTFLGPQGCTLPRAQMPTGCRTLRPMEQPGGSCVGDYDKPEVAAEWRPLQEELLAVAGQPPEASPLDGLAGLLEMFGGLR